MQKKVQPRTKKFDLYSVFGYEKKMRKKKKKKVDEVRV